VKLGTLTSFVALVVKLEKQTLISVKKWIATYVIHHSWNMDSSEMKSGCS
jgi:hypothetical protein